ncbi:hypothetical protein LJR071_003538 [Pseudomonas sp. LjRoot71]|uniref:hypothetical protein n=1 Tax=Pseudomonas sp. LjRoot71 TaxID=3342336 RepID=UPI003ED00878
MDQEIALFIGGPCDGERRKVYVGQPRVEAVKIPIRSTLDIDRNLPREAVAVAFASAIYDRCAVRSPQGKDTAVYVYGEIDPMAELIAGYREPDDAGKREQIEDLARNDAHVHACLAALRMGRINSYQSALEEMVIVLAKKSDELTKQLMQLHSMTIPKQVITDAGVAMIFQPQKPDPL